MLTFPAHHALLRPPDEADTRDSPVKHPSAVLLQRIHGQLRLRATEIEQWPSLSLNTRLAICFLVSEIHGIYTAFPPPWHRPTSRKLELSVK
jgi:hypothetical protein